MTRIVEIKRYNVQNPSKGKTTLMKAIVNGNVGFCFHTTPPSCEIPKNIKHIKIKTK